MKVPKPSAQSDQARADAEEVLESGGELDLSQLPAATVQRADGEIVAWGLTEVPGDSRLQAALALADANARAELVAAVRVGIAASTSVNASASTTSAGTSAPVASNSQEIADRTAQVANGILPSLAPPQHGWRKIRRKGEQILRVCSRISAREDALVSALTQTMPNAKDPGAEAQRVLEQLGKGHPLGSQ